MNRGEKAIERAVNRVAGVSLLTYGAALELSIELEHLRAIRTAAQDYARGIRRAGDDLVDWESVLGAREHLFDLVGGTP